MPLTITKHSTQKTFETEITVDLDEWDDDELIEELASRKIMFSPGNREALIEARHCLLPSERGPRDVLRALELIEELLSPTVDTDKKYLKWKRERDIAAATAAAATATGDIFPTPTTQPEPAPCA